MLRLVYLKNSACITLVVMAGCAHLNETKPADDNGHAAAEVGPSRAFVPARPARHTRVLPAVQPEPLPPPARPRRLSVPPELPGSDAPPITLPPFDPDNPSAERRRALERLYKNVPHEPFEFVPPQSGGDVPMTLQSFEQTAYAQSPVIRRAAADVEVARGSAIQAGLYPNPEFGYQSDTVNTAGTNGYHGVYFGQEVVTGGKLTLARRAAMVEVNNAQLRLRKTQIEVVSAVRANYFGVVVAREKVKLTRSLTGFIEKIYETQIGLVEGGEAAAYEPLQIRVLVLQARAALVQAQNEYRSAWLKLAAAVGAPNMTPIDIATQADADVPQFDYETAEAWLLGNHTDLAVAQNNVFQSELQLRLQRRIGWSPNVDFGAAIQKDYTGPPFGTTYNLQVGMPVPVFNRNQGNIVSAEASIAGARQQFGAARNRLSAELADAFARYESGRVLAASYRGDILRDQIVSYRGVYDRYREGAGVEFSDVIIAQQTLSTAISTYLNILSQQWQAVVDLAAVLQLDDLYQLDHSDAMLPPEDLPVP